MGGCMLGTWSEADAKCASVGGRLCTEDELTNGCADQTGCWYDQRLVWTSASNSDTCTCSTPGEGTVGKNELQCTNGETRHCASDQECYATEAFNYGEWSDGCRIRDYVIELNRSISTAKTSNDFHHLHIREIKAFDNDDNECELQFDSASTYMNPGKKWGEDFLTPERCIDGDLTTMNHNDYGGAVPYGSQDHWMKFQCSCKQNLEKIVVFNRNDVHARRLTGTTLSVTRNPDGVCLTHTIEDSEATTPKFNDNSVDVTERCTFEWEPQF